MNHLKMNQLQAKPSSSKNIFKIIDENNSEGTNLNSIENKYQLLTEPSSSLLIKHSDTALTTNSHNIISFDIEDEVEKINVIYKSNSSAIKLITIDLLLKKIACEEYYSSNKDLMNSFIDQFPCFIQVTILIQKIILAYNHFSQNINTLPIDILLFLHQIIHKKYHSDIKGDLDLVKQITTFYHNLQQSKNLNQSKYHLNDIISNTLNIISSVNTDTHNNNANPICSEITKTKISFQRTFKMEDLVDHKLISYFDIFNHNESDIAIQLTSISNRLLSNINTNELLFSSENREAKAPNLSKLIHRSNKLTLFIIEDICSYDHKKARSKVIGKYILIANELKKYNNYNDLLIVVSALNHMIIQTILVNSWNNVEKKYKDIFNELKHFVSFEELYKNIRNKIEELQYNHLEFTPYVGITLKKLSFLDEGNQYLKNKKLINFEKIRLVNQIINEFSEYKKFLFKMENNHNDNLRILDNINPKAEKELIILAKLLEPSFRLMKKKSKNKRMTKTESTMKCQLNAD